MNRHPQASLLAALLALGGDAALAHGDAEKPLFVAPDGVDSARCDERANPCASIGHALRLAGKGTQIRVAAGTYAVENTEDLFHLLSGVVDVTGGYVPEDGFDRAGAGLSILTGVPPEFRDLLRERGFHVIADRKGIEGPQAAKAQQLLSLHQQLKSSMPATPCVGGSAGGLPCNAVDLLSHVGFQDVSASPGAGNDVWGFVDLNTHREYVIAGFNLGTAVFDVTDPEAPREVGFVDGQNAVWRDIKVYQFFDAARGRWHAYAYVTTDGSSDGLFVIDLGGLPHSLRKTPYLSDFLSAHNVYATGTDFSTGLALTADTPTLVIAGSNLGSGQYRAYSLADPALPTPVGGAATPDYMHDASSVVIRDSRKDTQCVNGGSHCEVLFDFNESTLDLWDITVPGSPQRLSRTPYSQSGYTHSGWPSEDGMFVFLHDELDEQRFGLRTTLRVFSLASLVTPVQVGTWTGETTAIDHNGFVRGNRYYMSNYSRGLTVLDITNPATPVEVGRLDTYPFSDGTSFVGAWGAYPYLFSRTVAIQDIETGLYLAADRTRDVVQGRLGFANASFAATEGGQASITVQRSGGSTGGISVDYEFLAATADATDYQSAAGTLNWASGDIADKSIAIAVASDGVDEGLERVLVRLVNPGGGATLGDLATASLYIGDPGAAATLGFDGASIDITERGFGMAVVVLRRGGSAAGAASVDYAISGGDASDPADFAGPASGTVSWDAGDGDAKWIEYRIVDDGVAEDTETIELTLGNAIGAVVEGPASFTINIQDGMGVNRSPNAVAGPGQSVSAGSVVTLDGSASNDPDGDSLSFLWQQTAGPQVALSNATSASAGFTAPNVSSDTLLQFRLTVQDPAGLSDSSPANVTVLSGNNSGGGGSGGGATSFWFLLLLGLLARRSAHLLEPAPQATCREQCSLLRRAAHQSKGWRRMMVCSRSAPVEMMSSGTSTSSSMRSR